MQDDYNEHESGDRGGLGLFRVLCLPLQSKPEF